uniref:IMD domain-containing protein n=1 Tax=Angiostrongylus cantonensis TaxID=6313 RepID=A0A0K0D1P1_ANGCA
MKATDSFSAWKTLPGVNRSLYIAMRHPGTLTSHDEAVNRSKFGTLFTLAPLSFCIAPFEPVAMQECRREINESLAASNRFSITVMRKEQHNLRNHFESLCKQLGAMIECVEPVTRGGCGDKAAVMMLRFITIGFSSFEQLYSQLGISDQLPVSCKSLLSLRRRIPEPRLVISGSGNSESLPQMDSSTELHTFSFALLTFCLVLSY